MDIVLYRRVLSMTSGAGQLVAMQARGLKAEGCRVAVACQRGSLRFFLRTGMRARRLAPPQVDALNDAEDVLVVDHGMELPGADLVFVHNLAALAARYLEGREHAVDLRREQTFFEWLKPASLVVANSRLVKAGLIDAYGLEEQRVVVHHPGFRADRFRLERTARLRRSARRSLGLTQEAPLIGFVTSGDLYKRGLDLFLEAAEQIHAARPDARFLVVGSKRLPEWATAHRLVGSRQVLYRPKGASPEVWMAALDVFLYPARFEEFGMVLSEARALGVPILTSRRVGAVEVFPDEYAPWLTDAPDPGHLASNALLLIGDEASREALSAAGLKGLEHVDQASYASASVATIQRQNR